MSVRMITRAFDYAMEHELPPNRRFLLVTMADAADDDGRLWPSQKRLRLLTGMAVSTIRESIRAFEDAGILNTETRIREEGRGRTSNLYRLDLHAPGRGGRSDEQPPPPGDRSPDQPPEPGGGAHRSPAGGPPEVGGSICREPSVEPSVGTNTHTAGAREAVPKKLRRSLEAVAQRKGAMLDLDAVAAAIAERPDVDHVEQAQAFEHHHLSGPAESTPLSLVHRAFEGWLATAYPKRPAAVSGTGPSWGTDAAKSRKGPSRAVRGVRNTDAAKQAWTAARERLERTIPASTFDMWMRTLELAGEADGVIILCDTRTDGGWADRRYTGLIGEALATVSDFSAARVCDEIELDGVAA